MRRLAFSLILIGLLLLSVGVVLFSLAPFTLMEQLRKYFPQIYDMLTDDADQQDATKPELANITRSFDKNLSRSFITPQDKSLVELKNKILKNKPISTPNWIALRDWVGTNIRYKNDPEIHGESDYWQFPNETIPLRTGDCEDFSTLLCSLLRADGWSPDKVHVIIGVNNNQYHAWVRVTWEDLQYNIEPQRNGFAIAMGETMSLSGFNAKYYFNDEKFRAFN